MGITQEELHKVPNMKHDEAYKRIKEYYIKFMKNWQKMSDLDKSNYVFGNGGHGSDDYINNSFPYLSTLPKAPSIQDSIDLAKNVIFQRLEYSYHDSDEHGIKMAAYAHYIVNTFNEGKL